LVWVKLIICILLIFFSGKRVAKYGDIIAVKSGLGGVWIGFILLAMITSLPELFTGVSAITLIGAPDLTVGNILGANAFNLFNLAILDIAYQNGPLLASASQTHRLTSWSSLILVIVIATGIFVDLRFSFLGLLWIGWYTPVIVLLYFAFVRVIFIVEKRRNSLPETGLDYGEDTSWKVYSYFAASAVMIIGAGIWLAFIGEEITLVTGWGESFVGSLILAFITTLPEMTVSYTAMRMGATDMAIANMIGSNLFNATIIPIDDLLYLKAPILSAVSENHIITAVLVIIMTMLFVFGINRKPRRFFRLSWWNLILIALFLAGAYFSFTESSLSFLAQ
jgi:cation:H+ antiporter